MRACDDNDDGCDGGQTDEYVTLPPPPGWQKTERPVREGGHPGG